MRTPLRAGSLLALMATAAACHPGGPRAAPSAGAFSRDSAVRLVADLRHIGTPEGIDTLFPVRVGDNDQWVSVRGLNRANPVLVFIHGGPGTPMMPTAWAFQKPWEDFFTVVQWEQRGAGRNFAGFDTTRASKAWSVDDIASDAVAVIDTVRHLLGKEKVVVLGLSWGSAVGVTLAARRPDLLHAYVGTGQVVTFAGEKYLYDRVMELARARRSDSAIADLNRLAPYPRPDGTAPFEAAQVVRKWAARFNGGWYGQPSLDLLYRSYALAPEYRAEDQRLLGPAARFSGGRLFESLFKLDLRQYRRFAVPMIFLQGRYDLFTPFVVARAYADSIEAPVKKFITFERGAHFLMFEEPGRFLMTLVQEVLPLTHEAASFPVGPDAPR